MKFRRKRWEIFLTLGIVCLLMCMIVPFNTSSIKTFEDEKENNLNNGLKSIYMKADCSKILLYKVWWFPVHIGSFWFTSKYAYLCFFIEKDFVLKLNGVEQVVDFPVMVIPWRYIGFGPKWNSGEPCDGNISLFGICEDVFLEPYNSSLIIEKISFQTLISG